MPWACPTPRPSRPRACLEKGGLQLAWATQTGRRTAQLAAATNRPTPEGKGGRQHGCCRARRQHMLGGLLHLPGLLPVTLRQLLLRLCRCRTSRRLPPLKHGDLPLKAGDPPPQLLITPGEAAAAAGRSGATGACCCCRAAVRCVRRHAAAAPVVWLLLLRLSPGATLFGLAPVPLVLGRPAGVRRCMWVRAPRMLRRWLQVAAVARKQLLGCHGPLLLLGPLPLQHQLLALQLRQGQTKNRVGVTTHA